MLLMAKGKGAMKGVRHGLSAGGKGRGTPLPPELIPGYPEGGEEPTNVDTVMSSRRKERAVCAQARLGIGDRRVCLQLLI
jgi:hypothetical protein